MVSHHRRKKKKKPSLAQEPAYLCTHRYLHNQGQTHAQDTHRGPTHGVILTIKRYFAEWSIPDLVNVDTPPLREDIL